MTNDNTGGQNVVTLRRVDMLVPRPSRIADAIGPIVPGTVVNLQPRQGHGRLKTENANRLMKLEQENARLRKVVSDLTLQTRILKKAICKRY